MGGAVGSMPPDALNRAEGPPGLTLISVQNCVL